MHKLTEANLEILPLRRDIAIGINLILQADWNDQSQIQSISELRTSSGKVLALYKPKLVLEHDCNRF